MIKSFVHNSDNKIIINEKVILSLDDFKKLEPTYSDLPEGYYTRLYHPGLDHILMGDGRIQLNLSTNWEEGNRYIKRVDDFHILRSVLEKEDQEVSLNVAKELEKQLTYEKRRQKEYPKIEDLTVALWEKIIEENSHKADQIQVIRMSIKSKHPKDPGPETPKGTIKIGPGTPKPRKVKSKNN